MARNNLDIYENILILIVGWHSLLLCTQKYLQKTLNEIIMRQKDILWSLRFFETKVSKFDKVFSYCEIG